MYHTYKLSLTEGQRKKVKKGINTSTPINIKLKPNQYDGNIPFLLTSTQINKIEKMKMKNSGMILKLSLKQVREMKKEGGILPFLIPIIIGAASAIGTGALSALGSFAAKKILDFGDKEINKGGKLKKKGMGLFPHGVKP